MSDDAHAQANAEQVRWLREALAERGRGGETGPGEEGEVETAPQKRGEAAVTPAPGPSPQTAP